LAASALTLQVLQWIGKRVEVQVLALVALILVTVGAALILKLSVLLALLAYGGSCAISTGITASPLRISA